MVNRAFEIISNFGPILQFQLLLDAANILPKSRLDEVVVQAKRLPAFVNELGRDRFPLVEIMLATAFRQDGDARTGILLESLEVALKNGGKAYWAETLASLTDYLSAQTVRDLANQVFPTVDEIEPSLRRAYIMVQLSKHLPHQERSRMCENALEMVEASDTSFAIEKAFKNAKKNMFKVRATESMSIPHEVKVKHSSTRIMLMPAPGRGLVAGSSVRTVLSLAGITDVSSKVLSRSKNKLNIARATVNALRKFDK